LKKFLFLFLLLIVFGWPGITQGQQTEKSFTKELRYLFYLPDSYKKDTTEKWPLILFLHGSGERGSDLAKVKTHGPPKLIENGKDFRFIVVSPQVASGETWYPDLIIWMLQDIIKKYRVDESRIYLTGLSMGGFGTWETALKYPDVFAAIAPICGGGDPAQAWKLRHTPVWIFHGGKDPIVPVENSIIMNDSLKQYNNVKFTLYPEANHDSWTETYNNDKLYKWFLEHSRFRFEQKKTKDQPEKFIGNYLSGNDTIVIFKVEDKLWMRYGYRGQRESLLRPYTENTFYLRENSLTEIRFNENKGGIISSLTFYNSLRKTYIKAKNN
jgi:pimeloyl-ACP methyl ester carboxylesterase